MKDRFKIKISFNYVVLLIALVLLVLIGAFVNENFFTFGNFFSILQQMSELGIMSLGLTVVILTGGIDISIGTTMGLCAVITGLCMANNLPMSIVLLCSLTVGVLCGILNATIVAIIGVPAMIATLATQMIFNGIALALSKGSSISQIYESSYFLGQGKLLGIPVQALMLFILAILILIILRYRKFGKCIYAIGNNIKASKYSGINTTKILFEAYILCSVMSCIAGNIQVTRVSTARADMGTVYVLECLTAVVFGGTSISGGKGSGEGTILGVFIFSIINNILNLGGISSFWQQVIAGGIMIFVFASNHIIEIRGK